MYTWEIENLLKMRNYILYNDEYLNMISTSPQIKHIKYNDYKNNREHYFKYKVRKRKK